MSPVTSDKSPLFRRGSSVVDALFAWVEVRYSMVTVNREIWHSGMRTAEDKLAEKRTL